MNLVDALERLAVRLTNGLSALRPPASGGLQASGFVLGTGTEGGEPMVLNLATPQHLYMIGSSGSGKTTQLRRLMDADVADGRTVVILDLHGDLSSLILTSLAGNEVDPARVIYWDLASDAHLPSLNPLASGGDVHRRVSTMVTAIKRRSDSWGVQLDQSLRAILTALAEQGYSLMEVEAALSNIGFRAALKRRTNDDYVRTFLERFDALSSDQQQTQLLAVSNKLTPYTADPRMRRLLGSGDIGQLRAALDTPGKIVIIAIPGYALGEMSGVLGEMLINTIWTTVLSRAKSIASRRVPIRLVVDEFQNATSEQFGAMVTEGRRFGLSLTLSHQSQAQLPSSLRALIRNNSAVRVLLAPGVVDAGELATELAPLSHSDAVHEFMGLGVGEAFVVRRGEQAERVMLPNVESPRVSHEALARYIEVAQGESCRRIAEIDTELTERAESISKLGQASQPGKKEVRHERRPWR